MIEPRDLYSLTPDGRRTAAERRVPVLVHALSGGIDAGHAGELTASHLTQSLGAERMATFAVDDLLDYRSRRPAMTFDGTSWTDYERPDLRVDLLRDDEGSPLLLLTGPEPDLRWEGFVASVMALIEDFGVEMTIGVQGVPMGVPHTRPATVTAQATRAELIAGRPSLFGRVQVPGTAGALLQLRLGQEGRDAVGFAVNVPHYLGQAEYPQAAAELVRQVSQATGLSLPVGDLEAEGVKVTAEIDRQVGESEEIRSVVKALERSYDAFTQRAADHGIMPLRSTPELRPDGDDLAAQVEAFLAGQDDSRP